MATAQLSRVLAAPYGNAGGVRGALALSGLPDWRHRPAPEMVTSGVAAIDRLTGGLPRGALTELIGPASSGRTSLLLALLAAATARGETCALIDTAGAFDPSGAAEAGVRLPQLLWVRCAGDAECALKTTDLLLQGGGFGLVAMDLGDAAPATARRISMTSWFRLRRAVEHTPAVLVAIEREANARTCASLVLECGRGQVAWSGMKGCSQLLRGLEAAASARKPAHARIARFHLAALAPVDE